MKINEAIEQSAGELQDCIDGHQRLLKALLDERAKKTKLEKCVFVDCPHKHKLKTTLIDTIQVLEETRKAFKSKRLEALRKKLIGILSAEA
jgi:hypothetical protein